MEIADLVLPVFAVIITGWLAGALGYISQSLADGLVHFAYNVAMPALLIVTIAQEPASNLLEWRFLLAFGGGSMVCALPWCSWLFASGGSVILPAARSME
jgi:predicted permease